MSCSNEEEDDVENNKGHKATHFSQKSAIKKQNKAALVIAPHTVYAM
jgi:hypothetical protein